MNKLSIIIISFLFSQSVLYSQEENPYMNLKGRHSITMSMGFKTNSTMTTNINPFGVETHSGFVGSIAYGYWFDNQWAINFEGGILGAETSAKFYDVSTKSIIPILFGIKYYPAFLSMGDVGRVYGGINFGAYIGFSTQSSYWLNDEIISENVFGVQPIIGVDLFVADWLKIGPSLSYHILGDFNEIIYPKKNYSGLEFLVNFGVVF
jgi:hypothetical protein